MYKVFAIICIAIAFGMYSFGYNVASTTAELNFEKVKNQYAADYANLLNKKIESERLHGELRRRIETNYLVELERQKQSYETLLTDLHTNFKPSGVSNCPDDRSSVPRSERDSADLICYREADLRERVARSVAIANRCDELAIKYNALLRLYESQNEELKKVNDVRRD